jgi:hypothetical protein
MKSNKQDRQKNQLLLKLKLQLNLFNWSVKHQLTIHVILIFNFSIFGCKKNRIRLKNR